MSFLPGETRVVESERDEPISSYARTRGIACNTFNDSLVTPVTIHEEKSCRAWSIEM